MAILECCGSQVGEGCRCFVLVPIILFTHTQELPAQIVLTLSFTSPSGRDAVWISLSILFLWLSEYYPTAWTSITCRPVYFLILKTSHMRGRVLYKSIENHRKRNPHSSNVKVRARMYREDEELNCACSSRKKESWLSDSSVADAKI
jgi:hypothetical protein